MPLTRFTRVGSSRNHVSVDETVTERIEAEAKERKAKEEADRRRREEQEGMPGWEEMQDRRRDERETAGRRQAGEK